jgi:hypothetical protein
LGRFDDISRLFMEARELDAAARAEFLLGIRDAHLREELRSLLESELSADETGFLSIPRNSLSDALPHPGDVLDDFFIIR